MRASIRALFRRAWDSPAQDDLFPRLRPAHGPKTVVLSYRLWHSVFGGDRELMDRHPAEERALHCDWRDPEGATTPMNADVYTALQRAAR